LPHRPRLEELGYTEEQRIRMLSDKRRVEGQRTLDEVLGRARADGDL